ncbi:MAG: hypothetical protein ABR568_08375 [Pyrinomonadaceae bacterium]
MPIQFRSKAVDLLVIQTRSNIRFQILLAQELIVDRLKVFDAGVEGPLVDRRRSAVLVSEDDLLLGLQSISGERHQRCIQEIHARIKMITANDVV